MDIISTTLEVGLSYTAMERDRFKVDMTNFLNSSSLSSAAKSQISTSFNAVNFPALIVQIDSSSYTGSSTASAPATASWEVPVAFIGDGSNKLTFNLQHIHKRNKHHTQSRRW